MGLRRNIQNVKQYVTEVDFIYLNLLAHLMKLYTFLVCVPLVTHDINRVMQFLC